MNKGQPSHDPGFHRRTKGLSPIVISTNGGNLFCAPTARFLTELALSEAEGFEMTNIFMDVGPILGRGKTIELFQALKFTPNCGIQDKTKGAGP